MKEVLFVPHNHFDPVWRRCFDRLAVKHGVTIRSYAEVEEHVINGWLKEASKGLTFDEGQAAVWRKYLERNPVWVGLDGTRLPCMDRAYRSVGGGWLYHPPCPECSGKGCGRCRFRFATVAQVYEKYRPVLEKADTELGEIPVHDLNPAMPGCMVTHIRLKQRVRAVSYKLIAAEARVATETWKTGMSQPQPTALTDAWRATVFCQFHDAITGTHIDSAYAELMGMLDVAEKHADKVLGLVDGGAKKDRFTEVTQLPLTRTIGLYTVTFDKKGILSVETEDGKNLFDTDKSGCQFRRPLRVAELTLEEDAGDAWGQRISNGSSIYWNSSLIFLGDYHDRVSVHGGLPCYRFNSGCLDLSLLRSPESCMAGNMPLHYEFWDLDGQRDTGRHRLEYALLPYWNGISKGDLTRLGYTYNLPLEPDIPFKIEGDVVVTAWKLAENGEGWILRLQEAGGRGTTARLTFGQQQQVAKTDLLERPLEEAVSTACFETQIHKHGIMTLLITRSHT